MARVKQKSIKKLLSSNNPDDYALAIEYMKEISPDALMHLSRQLDEKIEHYKKFKRILPK